MTHDPVEHPKHYNSHPSGVECIAVVEHMNFNRGNAIKYLWRAGEKGDELEDLKKAAWYAQREVERVERERGNVPGHSCQAKFAIGQRVRSINFPGVSFTVAGVEVMADGWLYRGRDGTGAMVEGLERQLEAAT